MGEIWIAFAIACTALLLVGVFFGVVAFGVVAAFMIVALIAVIALLACLPAPPDYTNYD